MAPRKPESGRRRVVSRDSNAASRAKPSTPVQKLSPAAAARVRARLNANARMRKTLMTPGEVKSGVVIPAGGAVVKRFLQATGRTAQEQKAAAGKTAIKKTVSKVRSAREQDIERSYNYNPREVSPQLKTSEEQRYGLRRTPKYQGVPDRDNIAATNRMVSRKPNWTENREVRKSRLKERNSPARPGYRPPSSVADPADTPGVPKGRPGTSMRPVTKPAAKKGVADTPPPSLESMRFQGKQTRQKYEYMADEESVRFADSAAAQARTRDAASVKPKPEPKMATKAGKGSLPEAQLRRTLERELRLLDEVRKARRRDADRANGRYGRTPEESIAARKKYKQEHPKEPYVTPMRPEQVAANRTALVDERIKPVPPKPKPSDSPEKTAKINAEIRRVEEQNSKARKAEQDKRAALAEPSPKQLADDARLKRDPAAFKKLEADAKAAKDASDAKAVADRAAARASRPDAVASRNAKAAADKAAADARAERAAKELELLMKNKRTRKKVGGKKK